MVDETRLLRLLRSISDDTGTLEAESRADPARRSDTMWLRGVKYTFVTAIESCVDVAQHICSSEGWGPPSDNGDALRILGEHSVLSSELASSMRKAVGFRNVLVHEYVEVSDEIVLQRLMDLADLRSFIRAIAEMLSPGSDST